MNRSMIDDEFIYYVNINILYKYLIYIYNYLFIHLLIYLCIYA